MNSLTPRGPILSRIARPVVTPKHLLDPRVDEPVLVAHPVPAAEPLRDVLGDREAGDNRLPVPLGGGTEQVVVHPDPLYEARDESIVERA